MPRDPYALTSHQQFCKGVIWSLAVLYELKDRVRVLDILNSLDYQDLVTVRDQARMHQHVYSPEITRDVRRVLAERDAGAGVEPRGQIALEQKKIPGREW